MNRTTTRRVDALTDIFPMAGYSVIETAFLFLIIFIFQSIQFDLDDDSVTQARSGNTIGNKRLYMEVN